MNQGYPKILKQLAASYSPSDNGDEQNNTIKLIKDDIVIGGQKNPNVKITRQGKSIRIGQSSQVTAQNAPKDTNDTPAGRYTSINTSGSQPSRAHHGLSPRLASINSAADADGPPNVDDVMNSSCKDT